MGTISCRAEALAGGFELTVDGVIRMTAAYGLKRYLPADHERRTVWVEQRETALGSAAERVAIDELAAAMLEHFEDALAQFTQWLRERPSE